MPRNKSEKTPYECSEVDPEFYKLLRVYAEYNVTMCVRTIDVRNGDAVWGLSVRAANKMFRDFGNKKRDAWWNIDDASKRTYVADYMDYLYGTQSK